MRKWDFDRPDDLRQLFTAVNRARREHAALQTNMHLRFHPVDNEQLICYSKQSPDGKSLVLVVVNLNFRELQRGFIELPLAELGLDPSRAYQLHDLLAGTTFTWQGKRNYVELDPRQLSAHLFRVEQV